MSGVAIPAPAVGYVEGANFVKPLRAGDGLRMVGSSSGYVGFKPAAAAGSTTFTLPTADLAGCWVSDGAGNLSLESASQTRTRLGIDSDDPVSFGAVTCASLTVSDLTATRIPYVGTAGRLVDSSQLLYSGGMIQLGDGYSAFYKMQHYGGEFNLLDNDNNNVYGSTKWFVKTFGTSTGFYKSPSGGYYGTSHLRIDSAAATYVPLGINLASGQTADAIQVTSYNGTAGDLFKVTASGEISGSANPPYSVVVRHSGGLTLRGFDGVDDWYLQETSFKVRPEFILKWNDSGNLAGSWNLGLARNADGILEVNNGTAGQYRDAKVRKTFFDSGSGGGFIESISTNGVKVWSQASAWWCTVSDSIGISIGGAANVLAINNAGLQATGATTINAASGNPLTVQANGITVLTTSSTGGTTLTSTAVGTSPLIVKGVASQSANLQEWQSSDGTAYAIINNAGSFSNSRGISYTEYFGTGAGTNASNSGQFNTGFGYDALRANTTGYGNTAYGFRTLYFTTSGWGNTACGDEAVRLNTTGFCNTGNGKWALYSNSTGSKNTASGMMSLFDLDITANDGSGSNTALGYNTGRGIVTGINNTIIGANVTGLSASLSNYIILADGAGNQRIVVDSSGNVGIATTSPSALIHAIKTTEQLRLGYNAANYLSTTVASNGDTTFAITTGTTTAGFVFSNPVSCPGAGGSSERFGATTLAAGQYSAAFGYGASSAGLSSSAFGRLAVADSQAATAVGSTATAGINGTAIGTGANAGDQCTAIGAAATANATTQLIAVGISATASGAGSNVFGYTATGSGNYTTVIGNQAVASHADSIALGRFATTTATNQLMIGSTSTPINALKLITDAVGGSLNFGVTSGNLTITPSGGLTVVSTSQASGDVLRLQTAWVAVNDYVGLDLGQRVQVRAVAGSAAEGSLHINTSASTSALVIRGDGKTGINTTAPDKQVEINSATGDCLRLTYNDSNGSAATKVDLSVSSLGVFTITQGGDNTNLVSTTTRQDFNLSNTACSSGGLSIIQASNVAYIYNRESGDLRIGTSNTAVACFDSIGNFVVGGITASAKMHVISAVGSLAQRIESTATNDNPTLDVYQNRVATTDATATTLHTIAIADETAVLVTVTVLARRTGGVAGAAGDSATYVRRAKVKRTGGGIAVIGTVDAPWTDEDQAGWDCTIDVDGGNNARVRVTGAVDNNVTWHLVKLEVSPLST